MKQNKKLLVLSMSLLLGLGMTACGNNNNTYHSFSCYFMS